MAVRRCDPRQLQEVMSKRQVIQGGTIQRRILLVDDNDDGREPLGEWLQALGHRVRAARDGFEALAIAASFKPEVVLLDIGMPLMDGYEVCSRLRATEGGSNVKIYAVSGFASDEHRRRASSAGFDAWYLKPIDFEMIARDLNNGI